MATTVDGRAPYENGGAARITIGGVGGGGNCVPMLTLIVGFDTNSVAALSKSKMLQVENDPKYIVLVCHCPTLFKHLIDFPVQGILKKPSKYEFPFSIERDLASKFGLDHTHTNGTLIV